MLVKDILIIINGVFFAIGAIIGIHIGWWLENLLFKK